MINDPTISVTELLMNFNKAIVYLVSCAEKINLAWKEKSAYDEWDSVMQIIYNNYVKFPIQWGINQNQKVDILLPDYDTFYNDYSKYSYFVCTQDSSEKMYVFHSFFTKINPMDTVRAFQIDDKEKVSDSFLEIPLEKADFFLFYKEDMKIRKINSIVI
jgi:hypothetical protein